MRTILNFSTDIRWARLTLRLALATALVFAIGSLLPACGSSDSGGTTTDKVKVVAAENVWGSLAEQLGGDKVTVRSIITNPDADPHDYEPTPKDGAAFAQADLVIVNGLGYDEWATKAVEANPSSSRQVINVGELIGLKKGDNPHRWYSPPDIKRVITEITQQLNRARLAESAYFKGKNSELLTSGLGRYNTLRDEISAKYMNAPIGVTESVFVPMATDLKLNVLTPPGLMNAVSEGQDVTAADKASAIAQIDSGQIKVLVYNEQNSTPDVQTLVDTAKARNVPVVAVTETPDPAGTSFQDWQTSQLQALAGALALHS